MLAIDSLEQRGDKFTHRFSKLRQLARKLVENRALMFVIRASMAPFTHFWFIVHAAPNVRARFESLEFIDTNGPMPISGFHHDQVLCLGDLDYVVDHLGQLHLCEWTIPPLWALQCGPATIGLDAPTRWTKSHHRPNLGP